MPSHRCALTNPNYSIYLWVKQEIGFAAIIGSYTVGACVAEGDYVEEGAPYLSKIRETSLETLNQRTAGDVPSLILIGPEEGAPRYRPKLVICFCN